MATPELNVIHNTRLDGLAQPVQVIAVTGGKGGVGKTSVAVNLSTALAQLKRRVVLLDCAPVLAASEVRTLMLTPGQVLLVVRAGQTPQHAILEAIADLDSQRFQGLILNDARRGAAACRSWSTAIVRPSRTIRCSRWRRI